MSRTSAYAPGSEGWLLEVRDENPQIFAALALRGLLYGQLWQFGCPGGAALPEYYLTC